MLILGFVSAALAVIAFAAWKAYHDVELVCTTCGARGFPTERSGGSGALEALLWLAAIAWVGYRFVVLLTLPPLAAALFSLQAWLLLFPFVYSLYRRSSRRRVCRTCQAETLVPPDSPVGRKLAAPPAP